MNSIYLRSISEQLRSCRHENHCDLCHKINKSYQLGMFHFCCMACANAYHFKYDIAASSHTIFALLWLRETMLDIDIIHTIAKLLYDIRKRNEPNHECIYCNSQAKYFIRDIGFCSQYCHKRYFYALGYNDKEIKKLIVQDKCVEERTTIYKW